MTAPINPGIKFGFPPQILVFGSETPTATLYSNTSAFVNIEQLIVPAGVTRMMFECWGAGSSATAPAGPNAATVGASGGYATVSTPVQPGDTITLILGTYSGIGADSSVRINGTTVALAAGGGSATAQVGDVKLVGAKGPASTIDTSVWTEPLKPGAPRGAATTYVTALGTSENGSFPGGGAYAINGGGNATGGGSMIVVWIPQPLNFA